MEFIFRIVSSVSNSFQGYKSSHPEEKRWYFIKPYLSCSESSGGLLENNLFRYIGKQLKEVFQYVCGTQTVLCVFETRLSVHLPEGTHTTKYTLGRSASPVSLKLDTIADEYGIEVPLM